MQYRNVSWKKRLRYKFDNFMSRGGWSVFLALLLGFLTAFGFMGMIRSLGERWFPNSYHPRAGDLLWEVFVQLIGLRDTADDANLAARMVGVVTIFVGLVLFSSLIAFITQEFESKVQQLRKGKSLVVEQDHTLILGFNERLTDIIQELIIANESEADAVIVVLSSLDKEEMDDSLRQSISDFKTTRVVTRTGSITNLTNLHKVSITTARSVIILNDAKGSDTDEAKSLADSRVVKAILAVVAAAEEGSVPPIVVEIHSAQYRRLAKRIAPDSITTLNEADILARILVQTSRSIGLATVYLNIVGFEGYEFYFYRPPEGWGKLSFAQLPFHFSQSVPLGIYCSDGTLKLNPDKTEELRAEDKVILLAEDDSLIQFQTEPVVSSKSPDQCHYAQRLDQRVERHLIMGWNEKAPTALSEYAKYVIPGSQVALVIDSVTPDIAEMTERIDKKHPQVKIDCYEADIREPGKLQTLNLHQYNSITILAGRGDNAEEIDARTLTTLLEIRQVFEDYSQKTGETVTTELIAEIINSEDTDLVIKAGVKDFILSNQFVSKILAQVSQDPQVMAIYEDLFSAEGSELYIKPISLYLPIEQLQQLTFADCVAAAQVRNELCLGIKIAADGRMKEKNFGIQLVPNLTQTFSLTPEDALITLAEDET